MVEKKGMCKNSKNSTKKKDFYLAILNSLKRSTNLNKIQEELSIPKQNLNYYLRQLKKEGLVSNPSTGRWELTKNSKNSTKYGRFLKKDSIRGHAYVVNIKLPDNIPNWDKRIEILEKRKINFKLVGAKETTPRIKALGRKVWLCNDHIRIYDKPEESYYGENAINSRVLAFQEFKKIITVIENKLRIKLSPKDIEFQKEHYALIKNDLAIEHNKKGEVLRISDENGEWLLVDDSLGKGGELETTGKKALTTNLPMQKWWNQQKETKFEVTPKFITNSFHQQNKMIQAVTSNQLMFNNNFESHVKAIQQLGNSVQELTKIVKTLQEENANLKSTTKPEDFSTN